MTLERPGITYLKATDRVASLPRARIESYAEKVAKSFGLVPGADINPFVMFMGGVIHFKSPFDGDYAQESIFVHGPGEFDIIVSAASNYTRSRFTIAHELGHYLLHSGMGEVPLKANRGGDDRAEWEANWFAAAFLMPADDIRKAATKVDPNRNVELLAGLFGVSVVTARLRLKELKLLA